MPDSTSEQETKRRIIGKVANGEDFLGLGLMVQLLLTSKARSSPQKHFMRSEVLFSRFLVSKKSTVLQSTAASCHADRPKWRWVIGQPKSEASCQTSARFPARHSLFLTISCPNSGAASALLVSPPRQRLPPDVCMMPVCSES